LPRRADRAEVKHRARTAANMKWCRGGIAVASQHIGTIAVF